MTVSTSYSPLTYSGNGSTTAFAVTWPFFTGTLIVTLISSTGVETVQTLTTHYTVSGGTTSEGLPSTGTVTMVTAPASGQTLRIERSTPITQASTWSENDAFPQKTIEAALDKLTLVDQEQGVDAGSDAMRLNTAGATDYWDAQSYVIRNLAEPTAASDAVTKDYVDDRVADFATASLSVGTVTTGAAGSSASVTINGTYPTYTIDFTIPRGDTGAVGPGTGDVIGPASATDNAVARFDGTMGDYIQSSTVIISDSGDLTAPGGLRVGFTGSPTANRVQVGDIYFYLDYNTGTVPLLQFDSNDYLAYTRSTNIFSFVVAGSIVCQVTSAGAITPTTIELGHASDTTIARASAGELTVEGTPIKKAGKETVFIPASAMVSRTTNGAASGTTELTTNDVMLSTKDFDATTEEGVGFFLAMPKSWNEGTVTFKAFWTAASGTGGVAWGLAAYALSDDDAMDVAVSGQQVVTDTLILANDMHITSESSAITIGGSPAEGDVVYFELTREVGNASDTLAVDAKLIGIHIYYTTNASTDA